MAYYLMRFPIRGESLEEALIRPMSNSEAEAIKNSADYCNEYLGNNPYRLVVASHRRLRENVVEWPPGDKISIDNVSFDSIVLECTSWLLHWRLYLDHTNRRVSDRFGKTSSEYAYFKNSVSDAYDSFPGYRIAEGLRNYIAHRGWPPLRAMLTIKDLEKGERSGGIEKLVSLDLETFGRDGRLPRILRGDLDRAVEKFPSLLMIADEAMAGLEIVEMQIAKIEAPDFQDHQARLISIAVEADHQNPLIGDLEIDPQTQATTLSDAFFLGAALDLIALNWNVRSTGRR